MATAISKDVIKGLGGTLGEDTWFGTANGVLDVVTDTVTYKGSKYTFSADDFVSDDTLEAGLEKIFGGEIDIVTDGSGWGSAGPTFKYLIYNDSWNKVVKVLNAKGVNLAPAKSAPSTPQKPVPPTSPDDNY